MQRINVCSKADGRTTSSGDALKMFAMSDNASFSADQAVMWQTVYRARQLYNNISMLFLFPVKDGKLSIGVNATCIMLRLVFNNLKLSYKTIA